MLSKLGYMSILSFVFANILLTCDVKSDGVVARLEGIKSRMQGEWSLFECFKTNTKWLTYLLLNTRTRDFKGFQ